MKSLSLLARTSHRLTAMGLLGLLMVSFGSVSRAELLFDRGGGGPNQWNGLGNVHFAGFHLEETTRITDISGWFYRTLQPFPVTLRLLSRPSGSSYDPYSTSNPPGSLNFERLESFLFHPFQTPREGAGGWAVTGSINWDLQPGEYELRIEGTGMPFAYGNHVDPLVQSQRFDYLLSYLDWHDGADPLEIYQYPFGLRIYGTALTAVPEPATTGIAGVVVLLGIIAYKRGRARHRAHFPNAAR